MRLAFADRVRRHFFHGGALTAGNRPELAAKELAEVAIIESYLPAQLPEEQVRELALAAIAEVGAKTPKDMGKVMGLLTKKLAGQADGSVVSRIVKEELQKLGS